MSSYTAFRRVLPNTSLVPHIDDYQWMIAGKESDADISMGTKFEECGGLHKYLPSQSTVGYEEGAKVLSGYQEAETRGPCFFVSTSCHLFCLSSSYSSSSFYSKSET